MRAYPRVRIRPRPHSRCTPTERDYEESPRPATATSPHGPITPTHAHTSAQDRGPAQGQWWQRWTHTQLWELRKWVGTEPSLEGLVCRLRKGLVENRLTPICSDFHRSAPDWLHFGHFPCFGGIAAPQLSLRIRPIYF